MNEEPEVKIVHPDFTYRRTAFSSKNNHFTEIKLNEMLSVGHEAICVKYKDRFYIYVKVSRSVQVPENELPEPVVEGSAENGVSVGGTEK